jgi:hypothetical protein
VLPFTGPGKKSYLFGAKQLGMWTRPPILAYNAYNTAADQMPTTEQLKLRLPGTHWVSLGVTGLSLGVRHAGL